MRTLIQRTLFVLSIALMIGASAPAAYATGATANIQTKRAEVIAMIDTRIDHLYEKMHAAYTVLHDDDTSYEDKKKAKRVLVQSAARKLMLSHLRHKVPHMTKKHLMKLHGSFQQDMSPTQA